jgi:hypothetical protein
MPLRSFVLLASLISLAACSWKTDAPTDAPTNVTAVPGDGVVLVSWDPLPDLTYWIFYAAGDAVSANSTTATIIRNAVAPRVVSGLTNGTQFAFVMNATHGSSAAGPASAPVMAIPRLAGTIWDVGAPLTTQNLKALAFNGSRFVVVGDAATIFAGDFNYASSSPNPPGVTAWMPASTLPPGFAANLSGVIVSGGFLAMATDGSTIDSPDGLTWTAAVPITTTPGTVLNAIVLGNVASGARFVAVGNAGTIFTSADALNWSAVTPVVTPNDLLGVSFVDGGFIATGANATLLTSANGTDWKVQNSNAPPTVSLRGAAFSATNPGTRFVVVGDAGTILTSSDGVNWSAITLPGSAPDLRSVTAGGATGARFLAVGTGGTAVYSDDATTWTPAATGATDLESVFFAPAMYLAVGSAGANAVSK